LFVILTLAAITVVVLVQQLSRAAQRGSELAGPAVAAIASLLVVPALLGVVVALFFLSIKGCDENCDPATGWDLAYLWVQFLVSVLGTGLLCATIWTSLSGRHALSPMLMLGSAACFFALGLLLAPGGDAFGI